MFKKILFALGTSVSIVLLVLVVKHNVFAQQNFGITVYPAHQEIDVQPGETKHIAVSFLNRTLFPINGALKKSDFIVKGDDNVPVFVDSNMLNNRYAASSWIKLPFEHISVPAGNKTIVYLDVYVPQNALPGGHYVAVFFQGNEAQANRTAPSEAGSAAIVPQVGTLLYFRVAGDVKEAATVSKFSSKSFYEYGPVEIETHILNEGDVHIAPQMSIKLYNMLGKEVGTMNLKKKNIFPGTLSAYKTELGKKWMFGRYTVKLIGSYGTKGQGLRASYSFYVFPYRVSLAIILALIIMIYLGIHIYKSSKYSDELLKRELKKEKDELEKLKEEIRKRGE